jgi:hypothetical protein
MSGDTGLSQQQDVNQYVDETYGGAVSCMSADDRAAQVMAAVNERLAAEGIPQLQWTWGATGATQGYFAFSSWSMALNAQPFSPDVYESGSVASHADLLDTVYHEARHSEQWFRMARERAGLGATAAQIVGVMGIPQWVADSACAYPITQCDYSQYQAEEWYQSVYGTGHDHRNAVLSDTQHHYEEYRNLPEESDAWVAGGEVTSEYTARGEVGNH